MIFHQSPYGQIIKFSSELYYTISDEKLAEIEQNCSSIDREIITISSNLIIDDNEIPDIDLDLEK